MNYHRYIKAAEAKQPENPPMYDSDRGLSRETPIVAAPEPYMETELVRALYTQINAMLYPFISEVIDEYDYEGSPIYDPDGITRETLAQLVTRVLNRAAESLDEIDEIRTDTNSRQITAGWNRNELLNAAAQSLVLNDIFMYRRPKRRRIYNQYSFKDGKYNGMNFQ